MSVPPLARSTGTALVVAAAIAFGGCNSLLDNRPADLVADVSGNQPAERGTMAPEAARDGGASPSAQPPPPDAPAPAPVPPPCVVGEKPCGSVCVSMDDPSFGCGGPTCERCAPAHATADCADTACAIGTCDAGWADCNALAADGCETDLSSPASCGACDAACPAAGPNATVACVDLTCTTTCAPGFGDCNADPADGCEVDLGKAKHDCGACGRVCLIGKCSDGVCVLHL